MSNNLIAENREWQRQAVHCARQADAQTDPKVKQQFLEIKRLSVIGAQPWVHRKPFRRGRAGVSETLCA
jgi:hypothetical protein